MPRAALLSIVGWIAAGFVGFAAAAGAGGARRLPEIVAPPVATLPPGPTTNLPAGLLSNWDFELGLEGWEKTGRAFDSQPVYGENVVAARVITSSSLYVMPIGGDYWRQVAFPIGHKGNRWIGTFEKRPAANYPLGSIQGDEPTGALVSRPFTISSPVISFLVGGGDDLDRLTVELYERISTSGSGATCSETVPPLPHPSGAPRPPRLDLVCPDGVYRLVAGSLRTGFESELMGRDWWEVGSRIGRTARIRILDDSSRPWGHINVDDIRFEDIPPNRANAPVGGGFIKKAIFHTFRNAPPGGCGGIGFVDWDAPIWGVADLHTHPMSYLGFGGKVLFGRPDGDLATTLGNCNAVHGGYGLTDNPSGNYLRAAIVNVLDEHYVDVSGPIPERPHPDHPHAGWPAFAAWPHFSSVTHQQMRWEWIQRAQQGGLRVMVALAVNSQLLADAVDGNGAAEGRTRDSVSADAQIRAVKDFVEWVKRQPNGDFLDIVSNPAALRHTVRQGKLAVVLGIEVDNIGDFNRLGVDRSNAVVAAEIGRLYDQGVRYVFPVHTVDNAFGGAAVGSNLFNLGNRYSSVQPLPPEVGGWVSGTSFRVETAPADSGIGFRLQPLVPVGWALALRGLIAAIEELPAPFPNPCFAPGCPADLVATIAAGAQCEAFKAASGMGHLSLFAVCPKPHLALRDLFKPRQYALVKNYALDPDPASEAWGSIPGGHRNTRGLTPLGAFAVREMMRRGMLIDVDHASERSVDAMFALARAPRWKYPLVSGHNSFRSMLTRDVSENERSDAQLATLQDLGGMIGIGWGYVPDPEGDDVRSFGGMFTPAGRVPLPRFSTSRVFSGVVAGGVVLCAGSTREFAQNYLYAIERGPALALGSDIDGLVRQPGPRFGPQSTLGGKNRCTGERDDNRVNYVGGESRGTSAPLLPSRAGTRTYDFNVDGMAHYGLLPDLLQDLSNVGIDGHDMSYLFSSAEQFARMWERAIEAAPGTPPG